MVRRILSAPFDRPLDGAWPWHEAQVERESRGLETERYAPLQSRSDSDICETCGKPAYAAETCVACSDEEQAA